MLEEKFLRGIKTKIFADGADLEMICALNKSSFIAGITTNPTLLRKSGIKDYHKFARLVLEEVTEKPVSFEVFSDDFGLMMQEARVISRWGKNVYVKIPVTNTSGKSTEIVIRELSKEGIKLNVTAVMTKRQIVETIQNLESLTPSFLSVFAGRIADTGRDPIEYIDFALKNIAETDKKIEVIWASPREALNIKQASVIGCHVITVTPEIINKIQLFGKNLTQFSKETVKMFYRDAKASGLTIL